jgi:hypothetical protein
MMAIIAGLRSHAKGIVWGRCTPSDEDSIVLNAIGYDEYAACKNELIVMIILLILIIMMWKDYFYSWQPSEKWGPEASGAPIGSGPVQKAPLLRICSHGKTKR